ncbi:MAG: hypothetical protein RIQ56_421, partial [Candidatus Parcubacteria bacterium]
REIADRLGVSERAVSETLATVPTAPRERNDSENGTSRGAAVMKPLPQRVKQLYSVLVWQQSAAKKQLDIQQLTERFEKAIGSELFGSLRTLSDEEHEALRFSAEALYGEASNLQREVDSLVSILTKERLSAELNAATASLRIAESRGDDAAVRDLMAHCRALTAEIAEL